MNRLWHLVSSVLQLLCCVPRRCLSTMWAKSATEDSITSKSMSEQLWCRNSSTIFNVFRCANLLARKYPLHLISNCCSVNALDIAIIIALCLTCGCCGVGCCCYFLTWRSKRRQKQRETEKGLCGLVNIGNTCYMNSAIQCLNSILHLTSWCLAQNKSDDQAQNNRPILDAYCELVQWMWSGHRQSVTPHRLKHVVGKYAPLFADYEQKDAHEFLNTLLNAMQSEGMSIFDELFTISTESRIICSGCNYRNYHEEKATFLSLSLKENNQQSPLLLDDLIDDFIQEKKLSGTYCCNHCNDLHEATQKTSLQLPLPRVIIIQLRRFNTLDNYSNEKLTTSVSYPPENMDFGKYISDGTRNQIFYDLTAILIHVGNLKHGHYTTYARFLDSNSWFHYDDQSVRRALEDELISSNAYVLIYTKRD